MKTEELIKYIQNPAELDKNSLAELLKLVDKYPYFQTAHLACLKNLHQIDQEKFDKQLKLSSVFISSREKLYNLIYSPDDTFVKEQQEQLVEDIQNSIQEKEQGSVSEVSKKEESNDKAKDVESQVEAAVKDTVGTGEPELENEKDTDNESVNNSSNRDKGELEKIIAARMAEISTKTPQNDEGTSVIDEKLDQDSDGDAAAVDTDASIEKEVTADDFQAPEDTIGTPQSEDGLIEIEESGEETFELGETAQIEIEESVSLGDSEELDKEDLLDFSYTEDTAELEADEQGAAESEAEISDEPEPEEESNGLLEKSETVIPGTSAWYDQLDEADRNESDDLSELAESALDINTEKEFEKSEDQIDLIDSFIKTEPKMERPVVPPTPNEKIEVKDVSEDGAEEDENLISDTLAKIYIMQGYYEKAITAYEKLSLKYPEKNAYFGAQIEKIKKLINKK